MSVAAYNNEVWQLRNKHAELLKRYTDKPFGVRHQQTDLEAELDAVEKAMYDHPPVLWDPVTGAWQKRGKGLIAGSPRIDAGSLPAVKEISLADAGIRVVPLKEWDDLIQNKNRTGLKHWFPGSLDQARSNACAAFGLGGGAMCKRQSKGQAPVRLNPFGMYWNTSGGKDNGSSLADNIAYMQTYGCPSEAVRPVSRGWKAKPTDEERKDALKYRLLEVVRVKDWETYGTLCFYGNPVYSGYSGHAWFGLEPISTTRLRWQNSWNMHWGDDGTSTLNASNIYWGYGVWGILSLTDPQIGD